MAVATAPGWLLGEPVPFGGASPSPRLPAQSYAAHRARLGDLPPRTAVDAVIDDIERSGLLGRGGAGFPVAAKWRAVAARSSGGAVVIANGAEGEPRSAKDRTLMAGRPHLVIDGAELAADAVGADEVIVYVGTEHRAAVDALTRALAERPARRGLPIRLVEAPLGYVSGESSAAVNYIKSRDARPTTAPPHPRERGVRGRPTLVQNVESLAHAALIARFGDGAYRAAGQGETRGTALLTLTGAVGAPGVLEAEYGLPLREVVALAGGATSNLQAVLVGGYFGGWAGIDDLWEVPLDPIELARHGVGFGCGLVGLLPQDACGVWATCRIVEYMAGESARQCGPCIFGLGAIAGAIRRLALATPTASDLDDVSRWTRQLVGRGACHHPDGVAALLTSSLRVFAEEFAAHQWQRRCTRPASAARTA